MKKSIFAAILAAITIAPSVSGQNSEGDVCWFYKNGRVIHTMKLEDVGYFTREDGKIKVWDQSAMSPNGPTPVMLYSINISDVDSISFQPAAPRADLLDVVFNTDGTAKDISPMRMPVNAGAIRPVVHHNKDLKANVAGFCNPLKSGLTAIAPRHYYQVDFANNQEFVNRLRDGHTLEVLLKPQHSGALSRSLTDNKESKFFSSHQGGGTGFLISNGTRGNHWTFLPYIEGVNGVNDYRWAESQITPESCTYYHLIGVWDKNAGVAKLYVNGQKVAEVEADGEMRMAQNGVTTFCIGCDPKANNGVEDGFLGEIAVARIYDDPLTDMQISELWKKAQYTVARSQGMPQADLLDVVFHPGSKDILDLSGNFGSGSVSHSNAASGAIVYNRALNRDVASYSNGWGANGSTTDNAQWHRVQYGAESSDWWKRMKDGHTLEVLCKPSYSDMGTAEVKPFSSHQGGGVGFLISGGNNLADHEMTFLPHTGGAYRWAKSGIVPKSDTYYHVVGVYDRNAQQAVIYVNGTERARVSAPGNLSYPMDGANYFAIGADPGKISGNKFDMTNLWRGDVAIARIYDAPLTAEQVDRLWREVEPAVSNAEPFITNSMLLSRISVKGGVHVPIYGSGWNAGDRVELASAGVSYNLPVVVDGDRALVTLPSDGSLSNGVFSVTALRGERAQALGTISMTVVSKMPPGCQVVAHRGTHNTGLPENSRAAIKLTCERNYYGAELDVYKSTDGYMYVYHDATVKYNGSSVNHYKYDWATVQKMIPKMSNGERVPLLVEVLEDFKKYITDNPSCKTKLVIEIKSQTNVAASTLAKNAYDAVNIRLGNLADRAEYIAFDYSACTTLAKLGRKVAYLVSDSGTIKSISTQKNDGVSYDYTPSKLAQVGTADQIRAAGLTSNVWTINSDWEIGKMNELGYDFITTNNPDIAQRYYRYYNENK